MNPFQVEFEHYECMFWAESSRKKGARYDPRQLCDTFYERCCVWNAPHTTMINVIEYHVDNHVRHITTKNNRFGFPCTLNAKLLWKEVALEFDFLQSIVLLLCRSTKLWLHSRWLEKEEWKRMHLLPQVLLYRGIFGDTLIWGWKHWGEGGKSDSSWSPPSSDMQGMDLITT